MRAIVEILMRPRNRAKGMARNELRPSVSKTNRDVFDSAVETLAEDAVIEVKTVNRGTRYRIKDSRQGGNPCQGQFSQVKEGGNGCQGVTSDNLISLETRRSQKTGGSKVSCQRWFDRYLAEQRDKGHRVVEAFAVREAGYGCRLFEEQLVCGGQQAGPQGDYLVAFGLKFCPERGVAGRTRLGL